MSQVDNKDDNKPVRKRKPYRPETRKRTYTPRANKKEDILDAAMRVFSWYGYEDTNMEMIANEAGVSRALVIKYFHNVETVAKLCVQQFFERFYRQVQHSADRTGISYDEHTDNIFEMVKVNRAQWRFVVSYLLPMNRDSMKEDIPPAELVGIHERVPDNCRPKEIPQIGYMMASLYMAYIINGDEKNFSESKRQLFALFHNGNNFQ